MREALVRKFPETAAVWKEITGRSLSELLLKKELSCDEKKALSLGMRCYWAELPLPYLTGEISFGGLKFKVKPGVFLPRQETEVLLDAAVRELPSCAKVLEVGVGTGALIISLLLRRPDLKGVGLDVSLKAVKLSRENAENYKLRTRLKLFKKDFKDYKGEKFEAIITNPPYISFYEIMALPISVRYYEPQVALDGGPTGFNFYYELQSKVGELLLPGGLVLVEVGKRQGEKVKSIFSSCLKWEKSFYDVLGVERVLLFRFERRR